MIERFVDRVPTYPGRRRITPVDGGAPFVADVERADEPVEDGTPLDETRLNQIVDGINAHTTDTNNPHGMVDGVWPLTKGGMGRTDGMAQGLAISQKIGNADFDGTTAITLAQIGAFPVEYIRTGGAAVPMSSVAPGGSVTPSKILFNTPLSSASKYRVYLSVYTGGGEIGGIDVVAHSLDAAGFSIRAQNMNAYAVTIIVYVQWLVLRSDIT